MLYEDVVMRKKREIGVQDGSPQLRTLCSEGLTARERERERGGGACSCRRKKDLHKFVIFQQSNLDKYNRRKGIVKIIREPWTPWYL